MLRAFFLSLGVVLGLISATSFYAYLFTEQAHGNIVISVSFVSTILLIFVAFLVRKIKPLAVYESSDGVGGVLEFLFVINPESAKNIHLESPGLKNKYLEISAYLLPLIICIFVSLFGLQISTIEGLLVGFFSLFDGFWRSDYHVLFPEYKNTLIVYNSMLLLLSVPQALFVTKFQLKNKTYLNLFLLTGSDNKLNKRDGIRGLGAAFFVVIIVGILYQSSSLLNFLDNFSVFFDLLQYVGVWLLFLIGAIVHLLFVYFLSGWLAFRRDYLIVNHCIA